MRKRLVFVFMAAVLVMLAACNRRLVYDKYVSTPVVGWEKNDTLSFEVSPVDSAASYQSYLGLRITDAYPFTVLTLIVEQHVFPRDEVVTDTVFCQLTDERGNATGTGLSYHQYKFPVTTLQLQHGDSIHVRVRHDMKREILPGVSDIGLSLYRE